MDDYIAPINRMSSRIKSRILRENGILTRHYGIGKDGMARTSAAEMAAEAVRTALDHGGLTDEKLTLLSAATSGGDLVMPGIANQLQGKLRVAPLEARSHAGICAAGVAALKDAANLIDRGEHQHAIVSAVEFPSRLFRKSRFAPRNYDVDFDAHFLRWMLSDGAGAFLLSSRPDSRQALSLRLDWIHLKSFSGDFPTCMQVGAAADSPERSYLDYPTLAEAESAGAFLLRQDIRLLPQLFEVAIHEYSELVQTGYVDPKQIDHFLCHYSSERLGMVCEELMDKAGLAISREKWFSNLIHCGNTGAASIFIMLSEFLRTRELSPGQRILCFVPESGRFTVGYMVFTVVESGAVHQPVSVRPLTSHVPPPQHEDNESIAPPHDPATVEEPVIRKTLQALAAIWHDYRSAVWRTPLVARIREGKVTSEDYLRWTAQWTPQVREGSRWMRQAIANMSPRFSALKSLISTHAGEEQNDYLILFDDYRKAGGTAGNPDELKRNPGGEALNAYMLALSRQQDAVGLLGGIYIIEGTGQRIIPALLPMLKRHLHLNNDCFRFLQYHGENDLKHLARWLNALRLVIIDANGQNDDLDELIVDTARRVADLYLMQWEDIL